MSIGRRGCIGGIVAALALGLAGRGGVAATYTWDGGGASNNWSDAANWNPDGAPASSASNTFLFTGTPPRTTSTNTTTGFQVNGMSFQSGLPAMTVSGSRIDFVSDGATTPSISYNSSNAVTYTAPVQLVNNTTLSGAGLARFTFTGAITGAGTLTYNVTGPNSDLLFNAGGGGNTGWSGGIVVQAGTIIGTNSSVPFGTGTLEFQGGAIRGTTTAGTNLSIANPILISGTLSHAAVATNRLTFTGPITLQGTSGTTRTINADGTSTAILELGGPVGDGGNNVGITKIGARQLILSGANTFTGAVNVNAGLLSVSGGSALGDQATVTLATSGSPVLELLADETVGGIAGGSASHGEVRLTAGDLTVASSGTTSFNLDGRITGAGGLNVAGGTLFLRNGNSTYAGGTLITGNGVLAVQAKGALGTGGVQIDPGVRSRLVAFGAETLNTSSGTRLDVTLNGGILELRGTTAGLDVGGNIVVTADSQLYASRPNTTDPAPELVSGTLAIGSQVLTVRQGSTAMASGTPYRVTLQGTTLSGNPTFNVQNNGTGAGVLVLGAVGETGGSRQLAKTGDGRLVLSAGGSFTGGTTVSAGVLEVANSSGSATGSGAVSIGSAATLAGSGSIAGTLSVAGTLAPGSAAGSTGVLSAGSAVTLEAGSTFTADIQGSTPGSLYDQLTVNGSGDVTLSGNLQTLFSSFTPTGSEVFYIINNTGTGDLLGEFANAAQDSIVSTYGGYEWRIKYDVDAGAGNLTFGSGNDVAITAVPEPTTIAALAGLAVAGTLLYRRRKSPVPPPDEDD